MHSTLLYQHKEIIEDYIIQEWKIEPNVIRLKLLIYFIDKSTLFVHETLTEEGLMRRYAYHWQKVDGRLIVRWDNAPHWDVFTFPHHKHIGRQNKIVASKEVSLKKVLDYISQKIEKKRKL